MPKSRATTVESSPVQTLFHSSRTSTLTAGEIATPATVSVGSCKKFKLSLAPGLTVSARSCPVEVIPPSSTCTALVSALYAIRVAAPAVVTPLENAIAPPTPNCVPSTAAGVPSGAALRPVKTSVFDPV